MRRPSEEPKEGFAARALAAPPAGSEPAEALVRRASFEDDASENRTRAAAALAPRCLRLAAAHEIVAEGAQLAAQHVAELLLVPSAVTIVALAALIFFTACVIPSAADGGARSVARVFCLVIV